MVEFETVITHFIVFLHKKNISKVVSNTWVTLPFAAILIL